jgi:hypothetical protein
MEKQKTTLGLETLITRMMHDVYKPFNFNLREQQLDFRIHEQYNPKFVQPILSVVEDFSSADLKSATIILIEAVGASGKSELTRNISYRLHCPIVDLAETEVVAGNSLTGLLNKRMHRHDASDFQDDIIDGKSTLIIDALDEGYLKTNNQGYLNFIEDVLSLESTAQCPVIMLGRYNAVELAATYLYDKNVKFITLQIEPFTLQLAKEFIDKHVNASAKIKYEQSYKDARDHILNSINGFFKDQASIKSQASERFIGYAPVLQSIAALFDEKLNYASLLDELRESNVQSVNLIVEIIQRILKRDRTEKIWPNLIDSLIQDRDQEFCDYVKRTVYSDEEQCARILYSTLHKPMPDLEITDRSFLSKYNEQIENWINEHPFIGRKHTISNIVFESYILALLITNQTYQEAAYIYIRRYGVSYMFAYIYTALYGFEQIDKNILPFIYHSLSELNTQHSYYTMYLNKQIDEGNGDSFLADIEFIGSDESMQDYRGVVEYHITDTLDFGNKLEHMNINVPLDMSFNSRKVDLVAPSFIHCKNILIFSEEFTIYKNNEAATFVIECDDIAVDQGFEQYLKVGGPGVADKTLRLICPNKAEYPLFDFWTSETVVLKNLSEETLDKYKKLRSVIIEFRSHSKGELAKHSERIDFVKGNDDLGKAVIKALKETKVMYLRRPLYVLDTDMMDSVLGLSYDGIRRLEINPTVIAFLERIQL